MVFTQLLGECVIVYICIKPPFKCKVYPKEHEAEQVVGNIRLNSFVVCFVRGIYFGGEFVVIAWDRTHKQNNYLDDK